MNATLHHFMKRLTLPILFGLGILLAGASTAEAHNIDHRPRVTHGVNFAYDRGYAEPRWVRRDRGFRQWFSHSRYRYARRQNWDRLYDLYSFDTQTHRNSRGDYRSGKRYRDHGALPRRRKH